MDVRFCGVQEPQAERHHYVTGILIRRIAPSPERALKSCAFCWQWLTWTPALGSNALQVIFPRM